MQQPDPGRLEGRVAVVTGGGRGIGAAICERYAQEGGKVAVLDRDLDVAVARADALTAAGHSARPVELDISRLDRHDAALDEIESALGPIDVLVNNAGIGEHEAFLKVTPDLWDRTHAVNARGTFFLMQNVASRMVSSGRRGSIINVTSVVVDRVWLQNTAYAASKAAVKSATEYAASELGPYGVRVNNLCPGPTDTPLSAPRYQDEQFRDSLLEVVPLKRIGTPEDLAQAALFLASDESAFTTGSTIYVDGGRRVA